MPSSAQYNICTYRFQDDLTLCSNHTPRVFYLMAFTVPLLDLVEFLPDLCCRPISCVRRDQYMNTQKTLCKNMYIRTLCSNPSSCRLRTSTFRTSVLRVSSITASNVCKVRKEASHGHIGYERDSASIRRSTSTYAFHILLFKFRL